MPDLSFSIAGADTLPYAAVPTIAFHLHLANSDPSEPIHSVVLRAQIMLEVARRNYTPREQARMLDLFGTPDRWSQTLRPMLWTHAAAVAQAFTCATTLDLQVPCSFDFNLAATKYFDALGDGDIPLLLQFSGTVFYKDNEDSLRVAPISWAKDVRFRLPVETWKAMMDTYYPNARFLSIHTDVFDRLHRFKMTNSIPTWDALFERLLAASAEPVPDAAPAAHGARK